MTNRIILPSFPCLPIQVDPHAYSVYDAVIAYGYGLNSSLADGNDPSDKKGVINYIFNHEIPGNYMIAFCTFILEYVVLIVVLFDPSQLKRLCFCTF